ncbi:hypothetical protein ATANTOWER_026570 [Ataeniobius toweri]|uniref:Secreted protein n=1 Tax=Ataeniobius toweri TaxID=208326 RepID=A0ABU7AMM4_9TELE|nr:hypothetical protein [Ataeniobius toweri]
MAARGHCFTESACVDALLITVCHHQHRRPLLPSHDAPASYRLPAVASPSWEGLRSLLLGRTVIPTAFRRCAHQNADTLSGQERRREACNRENRTTTT